MKNLFILSHREEEKSFSELDRIDTENFIETNRNFIMKLFL